MAGTMAMSSRLASLWTWSRCGLRGSRSRSRHYSSGCRLRRDHGLGLHSGSGFGRLLRFHMDVGEIGVGDGEIALPTGITGIGHGEALANSEAVLIGFEGGWEIALVDLDVSDMNVGHEKILLPTAVVGIGLGESLS